ncbi:hypothetical protein [Mucilaginibacter sp.]|jgi:hypothetical protein|uniref:tetratricopeptide repeat protein n=1 Tax=Mucilaginibacter sp. TaxID=1882438 RepID=UPI0026264A54|nr:hypothetical protein [Mucilaginibacter sp.]MDB5127635.1 hypothetical protein [Mucilaginibacter sp.]
MFKKLCINIAFIFLITSTLHATQISIQQDTLINIIQQEDRLTQQKRLIKYIKSYFQNAQLTQTVAGKDTIQFLFTKYNLPDKEAFSYFAESIYLNKNRDLKNAEVYMLKAIQMARKNNDHYLLYQFLSHLSFIKTDEGDFTGAIYNYRMAKKEALMMEDNLLQILLDVNISDLYYKSGFYNQSINYLDQAEALLQTETPLRKEQLTAIILYNKSENFFRMKNYDSLKIYHKKLQALNSKSYKIHTYRLRTGYYLSLLKQDYTTAIKQIKDLKENQKYVPSDLDDQHLADAYFKNGQLDSAKQFVDKLLANTTDNNHPEIRFHLYELLAQIAEKKGNTKLAADNFKLALKESQENNLRITQVGNISSQMKIDETENSYIQRTEAYKRERLWLIFMVLVAALSIVAIALIYRNVKQKRHYEKLLFAAKREELAFINSHEVRKYLTNILGIMDILKHSDNKLEEYEQLEPHLYKSASLLDESIKNISEKLNDE